MTEIQTEYKYIRFEQVIMTFWLCKNRKSGEVIGSVEWYQQWKQPCFFSNADMVFSAECLRDIAKFLSSLPMKGEEDE